MTALAEYQRLECPALWRETAQGQRRDVVLSLGDASLVITDARSARALSHWSLPAIRRVNPGQNPALYRPGPDAEEELEIEEEAMVAALEKVRRIIESRRPHPGRLRLTGLAAALAGVLGIAIVWLPGALVRHTAEALPAATRSAIGQRLLLDLARLTGQPCTTRLGNRALLNLSTRLFGPGGARLLVLPHAVPGAQHLPGRLIVLDARLIDDQPSPDVLAGYALAEGLRAETRDPMLDVLEYAGVIATFRLLTSGNLPDGALAGYGEFLLKSPAVSLDHDQLLQRFSQAGLASSPYARHVDASGESVLPLIEADPFANRPPLRGPVMEDSEWVALEGICQG